MAKIFIFDLARKIEDLFAFAMSDIEACFDRQLPNIGGIVEESIGANRDEIEFTTKVLPQCEKFIGTTHVVSKESHGEENELLWGERQGNVFSSSVCGDVSCFMSK